jgi:hypothetical protein
MSAAQPPKRLTSSSHLSFKPLTNVYRLACTGYLMLPSRHRCCNPARHARMGNLFVASISLLRAYTCCRRKGATDARKIDLRETLPPGSVLAILGNPQALGRPLSMRCGAFTTPDSCTIILASLAIGNPEHSHGYGLVLIAPRWAVGEVQPVWNVHGGCETGVPIRWRAPCQWACCDDDEIWAALFLATKLETTLTPDFSPRTAMTSLC